MRCDAEGQPPAGPAATNQMISTRQGTDGPHVTAPVPVIERDLPGVAEWLDEFLVAAPGVIPVFGTPAWFAADEPTKLASLARWALLRVGEEAPAVLATRLAAELELARRDYATAMKQASLDVGAELRRQRELIHRRINKIGDALRDGDADRAYALSAHHASNDWAEEL